MGARFRTFRPGFRFGQICHLVRHGKLTLKQLRLPGVNETHTKSLTGPRLIVLAVFRPPFQRIISSLQYMVLKILPRLKANATHSESRA